MAGTLCTRSRQDRGDAEGEVSARRQPRCRGGALHRFSGEFLCSLGTSAGLRVGTQRGTGLPSERVAWSGFDGPRRHFSGKIPVGGWMELPAPAVTGIPYAYWGVGMSPVCPPPAAPPCPLLPWDLCACLQILPGPSTGIARADEFWQQLVPEQLSLALLLWVSTLSAPPAPFWRNFSSPIEMGGGEVCTGEGVKESSPV